MRTLSVILLLLTLCASGCANKGIVGSFYGEMPHNSVPVRIAGDAADYIAALYPPGHTALQVLSADDSDNPFSSAFEGGLRKIGFRMLPASDVPADSDHCISISYTLDVLEKDAAYYLQLRFSDGKAVARSYSVTGQPEAGRSATPHDFKRPLPQQIKQGARRTYNAAASAVDSLSE